MEVQHFKIRISVLRYKTMASEINVRWNQQSGVKASSLLLLIPSCCYLIPLRFLSWISSNFLHKFMFLCQNKSVPPGYWWHFHTLQPQHDKLFSNLSNVCIMFRHKILLEPDPLQVLSLRLLVLFNPIYCHILGNFCWVHLPLYFPHVILQVN